jgi:hypothetical protein
MKKVAEVVEALAKLSAACFDDMTGEGLVDWGELQDQVTYNPTWVHGLDEDDQANLCEVIDNPDCDALDLLDWIQGVAPTYLARVHWIKSGQWTEGE